MSVKIDATAFRASLLDLTIDVQYAATLAIKAAVTAAEASAKGTTLYQDRTGLLRQKTKGTTSGITGVLTADTKYAFFVENGRSAKVGTGAIAFVMSGGKSKPKRAGGRPFMAEAAVVGQVTLEYAAESFISDAITRRVGG